MIEMDEVQSFLLPSGQQCFCGLLTTHEAFQEANELYSKVFDYGEKAYRLNTNLLTALVRNGGSAIGIRDTESRLIGFAYGFTGFNGGTPYHYSQATVIDKHYQGQGLGRVLKNCQREFTLRNGIQAMRWTFDPLLARNGHFNFNSLGARGIEFTRDYYGRENTDRILVEWNLGTGTDPFEHKRKILPPAGLDDVGIGTLVPAEEDYWIPVPAHPSAGTAQNQDKNPASELLASTLTHVFEAGFTLVSCQRVGQTSSAYLATTDRTEGK